MGHCKWCDRSGIFFSVNERGLCSECDFKFINEGKSRTRVINNCEEIIGKSNNPETVISRTNVLIDNLNQLSKYEVKGIQVLTRPTKDLIEDFSQTCNDRILEIMTNEFQISREKIDKTISNKAKIDACEKYISKVIEIKGQLFTDVPNYQITLKIMEKLIKEMKSFVS